MVKLLKRAPPAAKKMLSSYDLAIELSSNEGPAESRMVVSQILWGEANLAPYDNLFSSSAIAALIINAASAFAVVAPYLSGRLSRLSDEAAIWIDVYETRPVRFSLDRRKAAKIRHTPWINGNKLIPKGKFSALYVAQPSQLTKSLGAFYQECKAGLRATGELFAADIVAAKSFDAAAQTVSGLAMPGATQLLDMDAHRKALADAKLKIHQEYELTQDLMMAIRTGFLKGVGKLSDIRALDQPWKKQRLGGFLLELETWFKLYRLMELGHVMATGFLAGND